jgi:hypothetical protein
MVASILTSVVCTHHCRVRFIEKRTPCDEKMIERATIVRVRDIGWRFKRNQDRLSWFAYSHAGVC